MARRIGEGVIVGCFGRKLYILLACVGMLCVLAEVVLCFIVLHGKPGPRLGNTKLTLLCAQRCGHISFRVSGADWEIVGWGGR